MVVIITDHGRGEKGRLVRAIVWAAALAVCLWFMIDFKTLDYWNSDASAVTWGAHAFLAFFFLFSCINMIREIWLYLKEKRGKSL